jgi:hypothetical protein
MIIIYHTHLLGTSASDPRVSGPIVSKREVEAKVSENMDVSVWDMVGKGWDIMG